MDPVIIEDVANSFAKLRMYPYFDVCNYILMSMAVKEDTPQSGSTAFSRRHPFSCWLATMLMCFGGAILSSFICGAPLFMCFDDTRGVLTATVVWYLMNYFPFDLVYRLCKFLPFRLIICSLKEVQRARKIAIGVHHGLHQFPESGVTCVLLGLLKGAGYLEMKLFQRLVRGVWLPAATEFLHPTFTTKISLLASVAYYVRHWDVIPLSENQLFLAVAAVFVYLRVTMILLGLKDPFSPFENVLCTVLFGGTVDALRNAVERSRAAKTAAATSTSSNVPSSPSFPVSTGPFGTPSAGSPGSTPSTGTATTTLNGQGSVRDTVPRQPSDKKRD
ncbi:hypothetical protein CRM22_004975 [Opisthorchis felineus]|uniref:Trimeric intracellular cation channel type B-A n=2 Tax=Opisthorchis felineus TaxID=147828 RepID=A0A4S2LTG9_OPIFE|nr:hypothetical protein CRM22_004975 [Opisthorchis felineus]